MRRNANIKVQFISAVFLLIQLAGFSQDNLVKRIADSLVKALSISNNFSGEVLISKVDEIIYKSISGRADFKNKKSIQENTMFCVGSITKTFTAVAIAKLWQQGSLKLDDPISKFLPNFTYGDSITIRQLLNHTAGIKRETLDNLKIAARLFTSKQLVDSISKYPLLFTPGSRQEYSNAGYTLLAKIIEVVSGKTYSDYLDQNIFSPLQMKNTKALMSGLEGNSISKGYDPSPSGVMQTYPETPSFTFGAGNIFSTINDLYKWAIAYSTKTQILNQTTWDTVLKKAYGFGIYKRNNKIAIGHDGIVNGYIANMDYFYKENVAIIFLSNIRSGALNYLADGLAQIYFDEKLSLPSLPEIVLHTGNPWKQYAGTYQLFPGFNLIVTSKKNILQLRGQDGYNTYLAPIKNNSFFYRSMFSEIKFEEDKEMKTLIWKDLISGTIYPAKKISD